MYIHVLTSAFLRLYLSVLLREMKQMARTRAFKSGNSQAVHIPAEIAYADTSVELEINRTGDVITIYPTRPGSIEEAFKALRTLPKPTRPFIREPIELPDRKWK